MFQNIFPFCIVVVTNPLLLTESILHRQEKKTKSRQQDVDRWHCRSNGPVWHSSPRRSAPNLPVLGSRLLRRVDKRPSLPLARRLSGGSAETEGYKLHWAVAVQNTTRAAG